MSRTTDIVADISVKADDAQEFIDYLESTFNLMECVFTYDIRVEDKEE